MNINAMNNDKKGDVIYSKVNNWFFIHIPKNGGTSFADKYKRKSNPLRISHNIESLPIHTNENHNTADYFVSNYPEISSLTPVCIVRNPWARCLSLYTFNLESSFKCDKKQQWAVYTHSRLTKEGFKQSWMPNGFFRDEKNMQNGIDHNMQRNWKENDQQSRWINENTKFFKLETELDKFYEYVKIPYDTTIVNASFHHNYRLYYDDELRNEISDIYKEDIEKFGYTF